MTAQKASFTTLWWYMFFKTLKLRNCTFLAVKHGGRPLLTTDTVRSLMGLRNSNIVWQ